MLQFQSLIPIKGDRVATYSEELEGQFIWEEDTRGDKHKNAWRDACPCRECARKSNAFWNLKTQLACYAALPYW